MQARAALLLCSLALTACATPRPAAPTTGTHHVWLRAYALGALGGGELDVRDYCPAGVTRELSLGTSWATLGISLLTLGVYTPREVKVQCAAPP